MAMNALGIRTGLGGNSWLKLVLVLIPGLLVAVLLGLVSVMRNLVG